MSIEDTLAGLAQVLPTVLAEDAEALAARERETAAAAVLLERFVAMVKPAVRALGSRPRISQRIFWVDCCQEEKVTRAPWRGVLLSPGSAGPEEDHPRANAGEYEGVELWLREDGTLIELTYSGSWSRWQGASSSWEAEEREYSSAAAAVKDGWSEVDQIIEHFEVVRVDVNDKGQAIAYGKLSLPGLEAKYGHKWCTKGQFDYDTGKWMEMV